MSIQAYTERSLEILSLVEGADPSTQSTLVRIAAWNLFKATDVLVWGGQRDSSSPEWKEGQRQMVATREVIESFVRDNAEWSEVYLTLKNAWMQWRLPFFEPKCALLEISIWREHA